MHSLRYSNRWWLGCQLERFARGRPRRWHPSPADTLCPAQLCSPLQFHGVFSQIRSQRSNAGMAMDGARCANVWGLGASREPTNTNCETADISWCDPINRIELVVCAIHTYRKFMAWKRFSIFLVCYNCQFSGRILTRKSQSNIFFLNFNI